jgi:cysteinyl-tRNA synthetase
MPSLRKTCKLPALTVRIYNTLSKSIEEFEPLGEVVGIYTCGPTVYDFMHIGNLRTFTLSDLFERALRFKGFKLKTVQNITDIDDKIIRRANERGISIYDLALEYEKYFLEDIKSMNITPKDEVPHATKYVVKMQDYTDELVKKGYAYVEKDGSVYFDISKFSDYGKLSGIEQSSLKTGTRALSDEYSKEDVQDFALWKAEPKDQVGWASIWGWGRPGWHIECSVMSQETIGETIDVHLGGIDLIFPHHENEIAQSEAKTGKRFVNYWVHGAHMLVDGKKMSKSLGNFYRLQDIVDKGFEPLALRYLYLQTHYRQEMNFTWDALEASQNALNKLRRHYADAKDGDISLPKEFEEAISEDLNFPKALSMIWENISSLSKNAFDKADEILGLNLSAVKKEESNIPQEISVLAEKREELRKAGKFEEADRVREEIKEKGFLVEDSPEGIRIRKN